VKPRALPQAPLAKWFDFQERCEALEQEAKDAEAEVGRLRMLMKSGVSNVSAEQFAEARDGFQDTFTDMQRKRARADVQMKLLNTVKRFIESLPANTRLILVTPSTDGASLDQVRHELKSLREELRKLTGNPPASPDIEDRVKRYVAELARSAAPMVRGYHNGGTLDVKWQGDVYDPGRSVGLMVAAACDPNGMVELIMNAITDAQPLSASEHAERVAELANRIDATSYQLAALIERNGGEFDIELQPQHVLGVRIGEISEGEVAA
jgi:hypothetical protein